MGQAKARGTFAERQAIAVERHRRCVDDGDTQRPTMNRANIIRLGIEAGMKPSEAQ